MGREHALRRPPGGDQPPEASVNKQNAATNSGIYTLGSLAAVGLNKFGRVAMRIHPETGAVEVIHPDAWSFDEQLQAQALRDAEEHRLEYENSLDALPEEQAVAFLDEQGVSDGDIAIYIEGRDRRLKEKASG